ncbi:tyrosine-protein phosphatase [Gracilibacillus alcaliphilus]|uniref:tyrosine-protein phosphatase n=1 Tax=Gracilibacillus alcaliphilus TaxID=1401441 RepID=UPI001957C973|nr:tyrosine-protein phosphatase [Gracilibacillus alcaliphilus]MBM7676581.1 protein-tyrosine phosphatase [Gracilibacillus alcaliphilus]
MSQSQSTIQIEGAINFRDLGGYLTADGRRVKYGLLYRSGDLSQVTEQGKQHLKELGIRRICDFRGEMERHNHPDPVLADVDHVALSLIQEEQIVDPRQQQKHVQELAENINPEQLLIEINRMMVDQESLLRQFIDLVLDTAQTPLVFHCTAGKDRTGIGGALILMTLGVSKELVIEDYLKTNQNAHQLMRLNPHPAKDEGMDDFLEGMMGAKVEYIGAFLDGIDKKYGAFDIFLEQGLGISAEQRNKLKDFYLE